MELISCGRTPFVVSFSIHLLKILRIILNSFECSLVVFNEFFNWKKYKYAKPTLSISEIAGWEEKRLKLSWIIPSLGRFVCHEDYIIWEVPCKKTPYFPKFYAKKTPDFRNRDSMTRSGFYLGQKSFFYIFWFLCWNNRFLIFEICHFRPKK